MKTLLPLAFLLSILLAGCAYNGPKLALNVGFMGATVGVELGSGAPAEAAIVLPPTKPLAK